MRILLIVAVLAVFVGGCSDTGSAVDAAVATSSPQTTEALDSASSPTATIVEPAPPPAAAAVTTTTTTTTLSPYARPVWLGTRVLDQRPDGFGVVIPTPEELVDRTFATPLLLPPPQSGGFEATVRPIPDDVLARSSWNDACPVGRDGLSYLTLVHHGFDGELHTGEMIVNARVAEDVVAVFERLFVAGFPIEEMRVTRADEIDAPPTGDGNVTGSFACRDAVNTGKWSQHAYGLAIDINPFHNPYVKGDLVIPELASYYIDRDLGLPGMVETSVVVDAFADIGWSWGGNWSSLKDWMHFSESGN